MRQDVPNSPGHTSLATRHAQITCQSVVACRPVVDCRLPERAGGSGTYNFRYALAPRLRLRCGGLVHGRARAEERRRTSIGRCWCGRPWSPRLWGTCVTGFVARRVTAAGHVGSCPA